MASEGKHFTLGENRFTREDGEQAVPIFQTQPCRTGTSRQYSLLRVAISTGPCLIETCKASSLNELCAYPDRFQSSRNQIFRLGASKIYTHVRKCGGCSSGSWSHPLCGAWNTRRRKTTPMHQSCTKPRENMRRCALLSRIISTAIPCSFTHINLGRELI